MDFANFNITYLQSSLLLYFTVWRCKQRFWTYHMLSMIVFYQSIVFNGELLFIAHFSRNNIVTYNFRILWFHLCPVTLNKSFYLQVLTQYRVSAPKAIVHLEHAKVIHVSLAWLHQVEYYFFRFLIEAYRIASYQTFPAG